MIGAMKEAQGGEITGTGAADDAVLVRLSPAEVWIDGAVVDRVGEDLIRALSGGPETVIHRC